MCETSIEQLSTDTVKLITSSQIITSVASVVKELIENSVDAGAKVIQIRLENFGLDFIEVKDDGSGVSYDNVQKMFLPGFTSKIRQFEDLDKLQTYGFRGEALAALCKIAKVSITTKTKLDILAMSYEIDAAGVPTSSKPSHLNIGTIITVSSLFSNLPVRRLFLSSKKKMSEELKKTEYTVQSFSLIHPELTVTLIHNKCPVWRKNSVKGIKQSFMQVSGLKIANKMDYISKSSNNMNLDLLVPRKNLDNFDNVFTNSKFSMYVYVNRRPLNCKILSQTVQEHIFNHFIRSEISFRYAVCLVSVIVPPNEIDINLEPNKTKVLLKNQIQIIRLIDDCLKNYYGHEDFTCRILKEIISEDTADKDAEEQPSKRQRLEIPSTLETKQPEENNKDWVVEIVDLKEKSSVEQPSCMSEPKNLCSQINSDNSVLTREEVSKFNNAINSSNHKFLISNSTSETKSIARNDIQSTSLEKPILKDWPCRPKTDAPRSVSEFGSYLSEEENKKVEEIAAEIEKTADEWSSEMIKAMKEQKCEVKVKKETELAGDRVQVLDMPVKSASSQMGTKKEMKAFTKFARIMRSKIIQEFPNIKFTQVAGILAERWKALTPDEVEYYEKAPDVEETNRKSLQEANEMESKKSPEKSVDSAPKTADLKLLFDRMKRKSKVSRPPRQEVLFQVSIEEIKQSNEKPETNAKDVIRIVGQLHPSGNWVFFKGREIGHVRHQGLQELISFQRMLSGFSVPRKRIEKSIRLTEEIVGTVLWNILITLDSEYEAECSRYVITSDVVTKNGFRIEMTKNGEVVCDMRATEVAESIPHFGILELKELLSMYQKNGEIGGLASWRPTSVYNLITNEAIRLAQRSTRPPDRLEIEEMIGIYHLCFTHLPPVCLHSKDIFPTFYNVQD